MLRAGGSRTGLFEHTPRDQARGGEMRNLELEAEGFRSLKNVTWKPGDLNVVIGPNGTGKSNLLRMLELISVAAQGRLGRYVQAAGGMDALVWDGRTNSIAFRVRMSPLAGPATEREL